MEQEQYEEMMSQAAVAGQTQKNATEAAQYYLEEKEKGMMEIQLEVDSIKSDVYHLLRQDRLVQDEQTKQIDWKEIKNPSERTLSDWGVERLMQLIHFYINKNTLMTNFDENQIRVIMGTFMEALNDLLYQKYELLFKQPTFEECKEILEKQIENEKKMKRFTYEILGVKINEEQITKEVADEMGIIVEKKMNRIKENLFEEKLRDYDLLVAQLEIIVYATLNRAYRGEERGSFRRHTQISELIGAKSQPMSQSKGGMFSWGSK